MTEVVSLHGDAPQVGVTPNPDLVERLRYLLEQAESGDLQYLCYVGIYGNNATCRGAIYDHRAQAHALAGEMGVQLTAMHLDLISIDKETGTQHDPGEAS